MRRNVDRSVAIWSLVYLTCAITIYNWLSSARGYLPTSSIPDTDGITKSTHKSTSDDNSVTVLDGKQQGARTVIDWSKFQHHKPEQRDAAPVACGDAPTFDEFWKLGGKERSRLNEDKIIYNLFFKGLNRTDWEGFHYLELGAFNGIEESNSRFYDECLGWEGLLIEPNPRVFPNLVGSRPHAHRMSYAASCSEAEEAANKTVGFWASVFTNAAQDESANREAYARNPSLLKQVPCGSLTPVLLDLFPDGHVHFFSLDTEGTEHFVLQNIDFARVTFDVIISESINNFCGEVCESRDKAQVILTEAGYVLDKTTVPRSDLYVHPSIAQQRGIKSPA